MFFIEGIVGGGVVLDCRVYQPFLHKWGDQNIRYERYEMSALLHTLHRHCIKCLGMIQNAECYLGKVWNAERSLITKCRQMKLVVVLASFFLLIQVSSSSNCCRASACQDFCLDASLSSVNFTERCWWGAFCSLPLGGKCSTCRFACQHCIERLGNVRNMEEFHTLPSCFQHCIHCLDLL